MKKNFQNTKVAIVYDRINKIGGAEKVLLALREIWPEAPIYTSVYDKKGAQWAKDIKIIPSFLQKIPFATSHHEWLFPFMSLAFESFNFNDFDLVISVTSAQSKGVVTKPETLHINYLLTPTKYLYSHRKIHKKNAPFGKIGQAIVEYLWNKEIRWDQIAIQRPDKIIAISDAIAKRAKKFYKKKVDSIIYPPVDVEKLSGKPSFIPLQGEYYLVVSRLVPSKRVDLAVKAFNKMKDKKLIIVGTGSEESKLKKIAKSNTTFMGQIDDARLHGFYSHAKATIMPQLEDFGIVAVESLAAGTPVISYKKGGVAEIVRNGKEGWLFDHQTPSSIMKVIQSNTNIKLKKENLKKRVKIFDKEVFKNSFLQFTKEAWTAHQKAISE